jgi:hypothetical protein
MLLLCKLSGCWQFALANILRSTEHLQGVGCSRQWPWPRSALSLVKESTPSSLIYINIYVLAQQSTFAGIRKHHVGSGNPWNGQGNRFCLAKPFHISSGVKFKYSKFSPRCCIEFASRKVQVATKSPSHLSAEFFCLKYCQDICKLLLSLYLGIPQHARTGLLVRFPKAQKP